MAAPGQEFPGLGVGVVIRRADAFLLYKRLKSPEADHWNIVGGKVDHMEPSIEAARREAEEETGLEIGSLRFLCVSENRFPDEGHHWVSLIYVTDDFRGEPRIMEPEKLPEFGWFTLDALPAPLSRFAADAFTQLQGQKSPETPARPS